MVITPEILNLMFERLYEIYGQDAQYLFNVTMCKLPEITGQTLIDALYNLINS